MERLPNTAKLLYTVSRPEFIPANSASLVIGLAWGLTLPLDLLWGLIVPLVLGYAVITLVAAYAAQINSLSDYDLDVRDDTKKGLVQAMSQLKRNTLKTFMALELAVSFILLLLLVWIQAKPFLLLFWAAGVFLAHSYSAPPIRLKSRGVLAVLRDFPFPCLVPFATAIEACAVRELVLAQGAHAVVELLFDVFRAAFGTAHRLLQRQI